MNKQILQAAGINYDEGVSRFAGKTELYEKYLKKFVDDASFPQLQDAMEQENYPEAFRQAHTLKGVTGNLSLTPLFEALSPLVEALRGAQNISLAHALFPQVAALHKSTVAAIAQSAETPQV